LARKKLARAAARLNAASAAPGAWPPLALMTDDERLPDPVVAARALPRGSLAIVRARDPKHREILTRELLGVARIRDLVVLVAGDPALAARLGADGLHLPARRAGETLSWRAHFPHFRISVAAHTLGEILRAAQLGADAVFLASVFPTGSHPRRAALAPLRASFIARAVRIPVYALGGVTAENAARLSSAFSGIAAIGALANDSSSLLRGR
jgi:thiamine-phosphate pyrophosphorylase